MKWSSFRLLHIHPCVLLLRLAGVCPCSWDLSQPPRDNNPAMRLYRHSQNITGLAQITDERLVSGSMDGTVSSMIGCFHHTP